MRNIRDVHQDISDFTSIGKITRYIFQSIIACQFIIALILRDKKNCSFSIWYNLSMISLLRWIALINVNVGTELEAFLKEFFLIFRPSTLPDLCPCEKIVNYSYNKLGIYSNGFINNTKELMLVYVSVLIIYILILVSGSISKSIFIRQLKDKAKWNILIRLNLIFLLEFCIFSAVDLFNYSDSNTCSILSIGISLFFLGIGFFYIGYFPILISNKLKLCNEANYIENFSGISTLINEFKAEFNSLQYLYYTFFVIYRLFLAICFVMLDGSPSAQLILISGFQVTLLFFLAYVRPFNSKYEAATVFLTEVFVMFIVLLIGFRSLEGLSSDFYYVISIFYIIFLYCSEVSAVARFSLVIYKPLPLLEVINKEPISLKHPIKRNSKLIRNEVYNKAPVYPIIKTTEALENLDSTIHRKLEYSKTKSSKNEKRFPSKPKIKSPIKQNRPAQSHNFEFSNTEFKEKNNDVFVYQEPESKLDLFTPTQPNVNTLTPSNAPSKLRTPSVVVPVYKDRNSNFIHPDPPNPSENPVGEETPNSSAYSTKLFGGIFSKNRTPVLAPQTIPVTRPANTLPDDRIKDFIAKAAEINLNIGNKRFS